jgi:hypothetical protein
MKNIAIPAHYSQSKKRRPWGFRENVGINLTQDKLQLIKDPRLKPTHDRCASAIL